MDCVKILSSHVSTTNNNEMYYCQSHLHEGIQKIGVLCSDKKYRCFDCLDKNLQKQINCQFEGHKGPLIKGLFCEKANQYICANCIKIINENNAIEQNAKNIYEDIVISWCQEFFHFSFIKVKVFHCIDGKYRCMNCLKKKCQTNKEKENLAKLEDYCLYLQEQKDQKNKQNG